MKILALEASAKACSVAVLDGHILMGETFLQQARTHSETLLPSVHFLLESLNLTLEDIDKIAVNEGPGSFTGLRIAIAVAKGLSLASGKPLVGVSTLEAMVYGAKDLGNGLFCPVMDARRQQVYHALFRVEENRVTRLGADKLLSLEEMFETLEEVPVLLGDGTVVAEAFAKEHGIKIDTLTEHRRVQRAYGVGLLAQEKAGGLAHDVNPNYIRASSAEREKEEKMALQ